MSVSTIEDIDETVFEVHFSENKSRSLVTTKFFKKDTILIEYVGELITDGIEMKKREIIYGNENFGCFVLEITFKGKKAYIDATEETIYKARLMNHSNKPNVLPFMRIINGVPRVFFKAGMDINPNTELVWNYGEKKEIALNSTSGMTPTKRKR
ncbi:N-lysine methyltransferase KMT5A-like, partial [Leptopilina boulardi]